MSGADRGGPRPTLNQRVLLSIPTGAFEGSYVTKILETKGTGYKVYAPSFRGTILPIPQGDELQLHFSEHDAHYEYRCRIVERLPGPIPTIVVSGPDDTLERVQRRSFFRLGANLPVAIRPVSPIPGTPPPGPPSNGVTVNLSAGGLMLESPELYPEGAILELGLEIPDGDGAAIVRAEVIRDAGRATPGARATWFLALEFLTLEAETQERITRYIYLLQRAVREEKEPGEDR